MTEPIKLYHYIHCPFCVRVRLAFGFLKVPFQSVVLPYNDEQTPLELTSKKMLPIAQYSDGRAINESLDIISENDQANILTPSHYQNHQQEIESFLSEIGKSVHCLCMPYWVWTAEFDDQSREYFTKKKEASKGPFKNLIKNKGTYLEGLNTTLKKIELSLTPFYKSEVMTLSDILIASHLWGMYIFPEFQFSQKVHAYLQQISTKCNFEYHEDFWK